MLQVMLGDKPWQIGKGAEPRKVTEHRDKKEHAWYSPLQYKSPDSLELGGDGERHAVIRMLANFFTHMGVGRQPGRSKLSVLVVHLADSIKVQPHELDAAAVSGKWCQSERTMSGVACVVWVFHF